jgi:hypothetical protein
MPKRRADADRRGFLDEFPKVRISRFRATGVVEPAKRYAVIPFPDGTNKLIYTAHTRLKHNGGWSFFLCPLCARLTTVLYSIDGAPLCSRCCQRMNIHHRSRYGFGRDARLRERDKHLDRMQAQLDTQTPLRCKAAPKNRRGRAQLVSNSRNLVGRVRRSMIFCRLAMLASQQAKNSGGLNITRAFTPLAGTTQVLDIKPIWKARTSEQLQVALDTAQSVLFAALSSNDPKQRLAAARLFLRTKQARERGW